MMLSHSYLFIILRSAEDVRMSISIWPVLLASNQPDASESECY